MGKNTLFLQKIQPRKCPYLSSEDIFGSARGELEGDERVLGDGGDFLTAKFYRQYFVVYEGKERQLIDCPY